MEFSAKASAPIPANAALSLGFTGNLGNIDAYISAVNRLPMLTHAEEMSFARKLRDNNDLAAAQSMVLSHLAHRRVMPASIRQHPFCSKISRSMPNVCRGLSSCGSPVPTLLCPSKSSMRGRRRSFARRWTAVSTQPAMPASISNSASSSFAARSTNPSVSWSAMRGVRGSSTFRPRRRERGPRGEASGRLLLRTYRRSTPSWRARQRTEFVPKAA